MVQDAFHYSSLYIREPKGPRSKQQESEPAIVPEPERISSFQLVVIIHRAAKREHEHLSMLDFVSNQVVNIIHHVANREHDCFRMRPCPSNQLVTLLL